MKREQLLPVIGKRNVSISWSGAGLVNYHVLDVGEVFLHGNGPGQGHTPIRLTAIRSVAWTEETRHVVHAEADA